MNKEIKQNNSLKPFFKYLLFFILLNSFNINAQYSDYQPNIPKILPNSPNSTALGEFGKIPVNYCFGKADISIPLYEINLCGLKLPISLNYNTSGIKLSQESTWVGLGWILNAGGCITHQCIGTDDFFDYNKVPYMYSYGYLRSRVISDAASPVIFNPNNKTCVSYNFVHQDNDLYDLEPDNFDFNFVGHGGSLYFNNNPDKSIFNQQYGYEAIMKVNNEYIKAYFNKQKNSWIVFDGNGFKYYFGYNTNSIEITTGHYMPQHTVHADGEVAAKLDSNCDPISHNETSSAWYLNKIEAPNGDSIHFDYEIEEICTVPQTFEDVRIKQFFTPTYYHNTALDRFNYYSNSNSTIRQCVLKSIKYKNNIIYFRTSNRKDLKSCYTTIPQKLSSIVIKQENDSICYDFKYSYLGDSTKNTSCRLILDSIIEKKGNDKTNKKYSFTYNKSPLPPKNSRQIDIWGFYNNSFAPKGWTNVSNNPIAEGTLIPTYSIYIPQLARQVLYYGRDRRSDFNSMLHGMLQSVKYPTGGRTDISYELNDFQNTFNLGDESNTAKRLFTNGGGLRVSEIVDVLNEDGTEKRYNFRKFEYLNESGLSSGKLLSVPNLYATYSPYFYANSDCPLNGLDFPPIHIFSYALIHSKPFAIDLNPALVGYDRVVESFSNNGVNGKNIYYYNNTANQGVSMPGVPIYPDCSNGILNMIIRTDNNNKKQEKIEYKYRYQTLPRNYSQALPFYKTSEPVGDCIVDPMQTSNYLSSYYEIRNYWLTKDSETQTQYFNSETDSVVNNIQFEYDQMNFLINKKTRLSSDQKIVEDIIKYPTTCTDNFAAKMIQYNLVNVPIEKSYYVNGALKLSNKTYYSDKFYNNIMLPEYSTFKQETNSEKIEIEYLKYDIMGNPLYLKDKSNINYCYIWSYNYQYPVAEIKNATYSQVSNAVPYLYYIASHTNPSDVVLNSMSNSLRSNLPNALITTYTYKPLVGVTSQTNPQGVTTYYEYDTFNRLQHIKDKNGKILQSFDYNYKH